MTRPWRRITLHLSQIGLTLGLTFMSALSGSAGRLLVPVDDATPGEVVGGQLHHHAVLREDPDVVLAHLAADVGENLVSVGQLDPEHGIGKGLHDGALHLDHAFLLRHVLRNLLDRHLLYRWPGNRLVTRRSASIPVDLVKPLRSPHPRAHSTPPRGKSALDRAAARHHKTSPRWAEGLV